MNLSTQVAKHLREVYFGVNWTWVNLKEQLEGVDWKQATTQYGNLNTIAKLVYHINYYVEAQLKVLRGGPLDSSDKFAFDVPPIHSQDDWEQMLEKIWKNAEDLAELIEKLPEEKLWETFADPKYGHYFRNLMGSIEHTHYHLGQIALIKKLVSA